MYIDRNFYIYLIDVHLPSNLRTFNQTLFQQTESARIRHCTAVLNQLVLSSLFYSRT